MRKVLVFLLIAFVLSVAVITYANILIHKKINNVVESISSEVENKTGLQIDLSGTGFSFLPLTLKIEELILSKKGKKLLVFNECTVNNLRNLYFSDDRTIDFNCVFLSIDAFEAVEIIKLRLSSEKSGISSAKMEGFFERFSINASIDKAEINYKDKMRTFAIELNLKSGDGKLRLRSAEEAFKDGFVEILFSMDFNKADLRFDKLSLQMFSDIISWRTGFKNLYGSVEGFVHLQRNGKKLASEVDLTISSLKFYHQLIDTDPFSLPFFRFYGDIDADHETRLVEVKNSKISLGGIEGLFTGVYSDRKKNFSFELKNIAVNKLETIVHNDDFKGYLFDGNIDLSLSYLKEDEESPLFLISGDVIEPKQLSDRLNYLNDSFDYTFTNRNDETVSFSVGERNPNFIPVEYLPDHVIWAVIVSEDAGFFMHKGVDFKEMSAAVKDNISKKKLRGGSTITQQIAKNIFLNREKTLLRKFRELLLAIELDATLSKNRLLEIYLNIIEWAPGVFGISQASWHYFGKSAYDLTPLEAAYLATVIPGPYRYHYQFLSDNISEKWIENMHRILNIMNETGHLTLDQYFDAIKEEIIFKSKE